MFYLVRDLEQMVAAQPRLTSAADDCDVGLSDPKELVECSLYRSLKVVII